MNMDLRWYEAQARNQGATTPIATTGEQSVNPTQMVANHSVHLKHQGESEARRRKYSLQGRPLSDFERAQEAIRKQKLLDYEKPGFKI